MKIHHVFSFRTKPVGNETSPSHPSHYHAIKNLMGNRFAIDLDNLECQSVISVANSLANVLENVPLSVILSKYFIYETINWNSQSKFNFLHPRN